MEMKPWIEGAMLLLMLLGLGGVLFERYRKNKGIGVRVIQFLTVALFLPTVVILALEGILETETVATLLGAIVGYVLSGIGKDEKNSSK